MPDAGCNGSIAATLPHTGAYQDELGYEILRLADGRVAACLEVQARHLNQFGVGHGGVALALLDVAGGLAVWSLGRTDVTRMATVNLNTAFLEGVQPGLVYAIGRVERAGGALAYASMALHAAEPDGPLLATGQGVYRLFSAKAAPAPSSP